MSIETLSEFIQVDISILWTIAWQFFLDEDYFYGKVKMTIY